ncbi:hypothetical protein [Lysinibacillus sphaericus]|uniref:hypothetical protein n=1 Tax=Lysinibacillus sphaericus TaxID=1421 RepID=UPI0015D4AF99|nr:hypothetical protein [Lysinibacillus sphaericus]
MKEIFSQGIVEKTAYLNWRTNRHDHIQNMLVIADGFRDSALLLVKELLKDNTTKRADNIIFPVLFNANHSIEVYLKAICWTQNLLLGNGDNFDGTHNLKSLFNKVVELEHKLNPQSDNTTFMDMLSKLDAYIVELYGNIERTVNRNGNDKIIHDITFCRYTLSNDMEPQFYINTFENVVVDLENFLEVFKEIFDNLRSLSMQYQVQLEGKLEAQYAGRE